MNASLIGDLPDAICNQYRSEIVKGMIKDVTHCPNMRSSMFSIPKFFLE